MSNAAAEFFVDIRMINRRIADLAGVVLTTDGDVLRSTSSVVRSLWAFVGAMFALIVCKAALIAYIGMTGYSAAVAMLADGTPVERLGAFMMQAGGFSSILAHLIRIIVG